MVQETISLKLFEKSSSLAGVNCQRFYHQLEHRVLASASLHCVSQGPQAVGRLMGAVVVEMRAYLQQAATVSVPKRKFHLAKL